MNSIPLTCFVEVNPPVRVPPGLQPDSDVSFIPMQDVSDNGEWVVRQTRKLKEVQTGYTRFQDGDVLFAKITPCMENGKGAHAVGLKNGIGFGSTEFHVLRARQSADSRFIYHWSRFPQLRLAAEAVMIGSAGQQRVPASFFCSFRVPALSLQQQRRIAEILDTVDEAIQQTEAVIAKLKEMKQGLLHDLLTRGLDENGELRDPVAHPELFKDSPLGRIPREWEAVRIGDVAIHVGSGLTPRGGRSVYRDRGVLFIRSQNVTFEGLVLDDAAYIDMRTHAAMSRSEIFTYDVLLNITGASIGRCCTVSVGLGPANVNQHVCAIRLPQATASDATFLSSVLASPIGQLQIERLNAGGNREGLNYAQLRSFLVPWPTREERHRISMVLIANDERIQLEQRNRNKLESLKHALMQDLLTGRVRVPLPDTHSELVEATT